MGWNYTPFETLIGKTLVKIGGASVGSESIEFHTADEAFTMSHSQECCENVQVEEVHGDISDLIGTPILLAEAVKSADVPEGWTRDYAPESATWTFYKLATVKGHVTIRWVGESNGYYSTSVDFQKALS